MRLAKVIGVVTMSHRLDGLCPGQYLIADVLDDQALADDLPGRSSAGKAAMSESLVVFDQLGAGVGQMIAVSEGGEAAMPFKPEKVPVDAYNTAIIDSYDWQS